MNRTDDFIESSRGYLNSIFKTVRLWFCDRLIKRKKPKKWHNILRSNKIEKREETREESKNMKIQQYNLVGSREGLTIFIKENIFPYLRPFPLSYLKQAI